MTYLHAFESLRRASTNGGAPHKPILLLAVCNLVQQRLITSSTIEITPELVFEFKEVWSRIVDSIHIPTFSLPFFYLRSEPFWHLIAKNSSAMPQSISSIGVLKRFVHHPRIDEALFEVMRDRVGNQVLRETLLKRYFPLITEDDAYGTNQVENHIKEQILNDDPRQYSLRLEEFQAALTSAEYEEEIYVRGGIFKREIPKIYNYQCAVSGLRIETSTGAQMIDACHIIPFAESKNDTIHNGISLSPTFHRAFDRGLVTITRDFRVKISKTIRENNSPHSIMQFQGKQIHLPQHERHFPAIENLKWHNKKWQHLH